MRAHLAFSPYIPHGCAMGHMLTQFDADEGEKNAAEVLRRARAKFPDIRFCPSDLEHEGPIVHGWFAQGTPQKDLIVSAGRRTHLYDLHHDFTVPPMLYFGLMLEGLMHNRMGHQQIDVTSGTFLAAATTEPQQLHTLHPAGYRIDIASVQVHPGWLAAHFPELDDPIRAISGGQRLCLGQADARMIMLAQQIQSLIRDTSMAGRLHFEAAVVDFVAVMCGVFSDTFAVSTGGLPPGAMRRMTDLRARLDAVAPGEEITLASLAAEFGASASTLSRQFRAAFDTSVMQYLADHRMNMARAALEKDEMSVAQAAFTAGFSGPANFTTAFKRTFGITPAEARRTKSLIRIS